MTGPGVLLVTAPIDANVKRPLFRSKRMMEIMRDLPCGVCGAQDGTVVAAHRNEGKGMGLKVSDALVAAMCYRCHMELDQGKGTREVKRQMWNQAYVNSIQYLIENNTLVIK